jgi:hypothetical protein
MAKLPAHAPVITIHGNCPHRHYAVWRDYAEVFFQSSEYKKDLPKAADWLQINESLFRYISNSLRIVNPQAYACYTSVKEPLEAIDLKPMCEAWFSVAINQDQKNGDTGIHQDWRDHRYNCVIPWDNYTSKFPVLWQLKLMIEPKPDDVFFFAGSLIAHNTTDIVGTCNSVDFFCHKNVLKSKNDLKK